MSTGWGSRRSERLRVNLFARCRTPGEGEPDNDVLLVNITPEGCCMATGGMTLRVGQPVNIRLSGGEGLTGIVRWANDEQAGIEFETPLARARVDYLRREHSTFLCDVAWPETPVKRSVV